MFSVFSYVFKVMCLFIMKYDDGKGEGAMANIWAFDLMNLINKG